MKALPRGDEGSSSKTKKRSKCKTKRCCEKCYPSKGEGQRQLSTSTVDQKKGEEWGSHTVPRTLQELYTSWKSLVFHKGFHLIHVHDSIAVIAFNFPALLQTEQCILLAAKLKH